jgi:hypothetical protein
MLLPKYKKFQQERQVGEYTILLPNPPSIEKIANYNVPKQQQKFRPTVLPADIKSWDASTRDAFEEQEWDRRMNGYWFFNNGNIEYITGTHYLYTNWWKIDIGLPSFVDSDRDWFYMWDYVKGNPKARGLIYISNRREGKTFKGTCCVYDEISKAQNAQGGIQSKTGGDAKKVFDKLILSWKKLPYFFKPIDSGDSNPKSSLDFTEPGTRNTKEQNKTYNLVLDSFIDFENAKEEAYDGTKQKINFQDEIGKTVECSVYDRINIVKECVMDGSKIIGKIIATTTVEEMEKKGGTECKKVWDAADPKNILPNGETQQGLLRYFKPAYYGYRGENNEGVSFIDEYGYSRQELAKKYIQEKRDAMKNRDDVVSDRRKYPFTIQDCFIQDSRKSVYDTIKIEQQLTYNDTINLNKLVVRGNFVWKGGIKDTEVEWIPHPEGKWANAWLPKNEKRNNTVNKYGKKAPANTEFGCFGLDPYDNKTTVDNRKSDAASYGYRKFDPLDASQSDLFISEYVNRPKLPETMWEDMIMQCVFYGWEILIESNKIGTINYFRMRGYENYLMDRPAETQTEYSDKRQEEKGIPMTGQEARMSLIYGTESYIIRRVGLIEEEGKEPYMGRCYFNKLLISWQEFDFDKQWTEFDCMVGAGLAILGSRKYIPRKISNTIPNIFKQYKSVDGQYVENNGQDVNAPPGSVIITNFNTGFSGQSL